MRPNNPRKFLSGEETAAVERAIGQAEARTSAQIKFVIARHCWGHIRDKAVRLFKTLGLHQTSHHNCVLVLLITTNREFIIFGDVGIHEKAGQAHWDSVRDHMAKRFKEDAFAQGLSEGIQMIGEQLAQFFPAHPTDKNEISNDVAYQD